MICSVVEMPDGVRAIVCTSGRRKRCGCGKPAPLLCDWKVPTSKTGTCDVSLCASCSTKPAPGKDLCKTHAAEWAARGNR